MKTQNLTIISADGNTTITASITKPITTAGLLEVAKGFAAMEAWKPEPEAETAERETVRLADSEKESLSRSHVLPVSQSSAEGAPC